MSLSPIGRRRNSTETFVFAYVAAIAFGNWMGTAAAGVFMFALIGWFWGLVDFVVRWSTHWKDNRDEPPL